MKKKPVTKTWGPTTKAVHAGMHENTSRSVTTPIYQTSTFALQENREGAEFANSIEPSAFYTRWGNPNFAEVEAVIAALEGAERALVSSSGMAATATIFETFLQHGDHVIAPAASYLGTELLLKHLITSKNIKVTFIHNTLDMDEWERAASVPTKLLWIETPSNPTLGITDIGKIVQLAQRHHIKTVADNTFASPIHTRPIEWGIDLSMSSATKYLGGHSDVTAGVIAGSDADVTACWKVARLTGPTIDPIGAWLLHRGIKTLALRVTRSSASAMTLAQWLSQHPQVERVDYPGLPSHPGHEIAKRQMQDGFGGVLSFQIQGGLEAGSRFCESLQMVYRAVSLGGVESLIQHPASMTHIFVDEATKKNLGITPGLLRFATGIEDVQDIQSDFELAFTAAL